MSLPSNYSRSSLDGLRPTRLARGSFARLERRGRSSLPGGGGDPRHVHPLDLGPHTRLIRLTEPAEAELLTTAFFRYAELHGRVVCDPMSRCALAAAPSRGPGRTATALLTLWSAHAAAGFDRFWTAYRRAYGKCADYALSPAA